MKRNTTTLFLVAASAVTFAGCLEPNPFCASNFRFGISGDFQSTPLGEDLSPSNLELECNGPDGLMVDLATMPEIANAAFEGDGRFAGQDKFDRINAVMLAIAAGNGLSQPQQAIDEYLALATT